MRDLAERLENPWLAAVSRVYLGMLALAQARPEEEARDLLDEGLELSRFDQMYATGSRLSQQEAVAAVRDRRGAPAPRPF